jgi:L-aminopeptidase/D-esterase-like protein
MGRRESIALVGPALLGLIATSPAGAQPSGDPVPVADSTGRALRFEFPGLRIGVAEYQEGPTGTTVFYFPSGVKAAADVRGGAPGTLNSDAVRLGYESPMMQAVVFAGGSWYGLSAATGVANELKAIRAKEGDPDFIAGVLGAIIYDVGGRRFTRITPDDRLGAHALRSAREGWFPLGARGAGRFAMQGVYFLSAVNPETASRWPHSGQGGAFRQVGPTKIAVFTVVNALGTIVKRDGRVARCHRTREETCPLIASLLQERLGRPAASNGGGSGKGSDRSEGDGRSGERPTGNTTVTLVVTNQKLAYWALQRLAVQVHTSMARAIQPFATEDDGDVLYAVTTDAVDHPALPPMALAAVASEVAWDAVLSSLPELPPRPLLSTSATPSDPVRLGELAGTFEFPGGGALSVGRDGEALVARFVGRGRIYFEENRLYRLLPAGPDRFLVEGPGGDVVQFERAAPGVTGLIVNPGPWPQRAVRRP